MPKKMDPAQKKKSRGVTLDPDVWERLDWYNENVGKNVSKQINDTLRQEIYINRPEDYNVKGAKK